MAYQIAAIRMTLSVLQGHSPVARHFKWDFLYSDAAIERISTDIVHHVVPLR